MSGALSDLDKIKEILFGHEKKALDAITRRLETRETRTADVADVLPDAISQSYDHDPRLRTSLREPIEDSITDSIRRDPGKFADALFPVIGPAIRKAISEALKSIVQSLNRAAETSLSPTARYRAWRAGVPLGTWVLHNSLVYRVDEIYLINPKNGLLIEHVSHQDAPHKDEDAISAMLTAIQDFVRDSFAGGQSALDSAVLGELTVWISHGPRAMLAAVVRGTPPAQLRPLLDATIERIHLHHNRALRKFSGTAIRGLDTELEACLLFRLREEARSATGMPTSIRLVLIGLVGALVWWLTNGFFLDRKLNRWGVALRSEPGIIVTQLERHGRVFHAGGLRDPLAVEPVELAHDAEIPVDSLALDFRPFQSLDAEILVARSRQVLRPPASVAMQVTDGRLIATGVAPLAWRQRVANVAPAIAGISAVDISGVLPDDGDLLTQVREAVDPPASVSTRVVNGRAIFSGSAPGLWIDQLTTRLTSLVGLTGIDTGDLDPDELIELRRLAKQINGQQVFFLNNDELAPDQRSGVARVASQMRLFARNALALDLEPVFALTGFTDDSGLVVANRALQISRAQTTKRLLVAYGVNPDWLFVQGARRVGEGSLEATLSERKVAIEIQTRGPGGTSLIEP